MSDKESTIRNVPLSDLTECLQWLLPRVLPTRRQGIVVQLSDRIANRRSSDIIAVESQHGGKVSGTAIAMLQPCGAATLLAFSEEMVDDARPLLEALIGRLGRYEVRFVQYSSDIDSAESGTMTVDPVSLGFEPIANLAFLLIERDLFGQLVKDASDTNTAPSVNSALMKVGDDPAKRELACEIASRSFQLTKDCPRLSDFRSAAEIVQGYQESTCFDPDRWHVLIDGDVPVGCLFLSMHGTEATDNETAPGDSGVAMEVSYMGIVPEHRGKGLGNVLLEHAYRIAIAQNVARIVLAVDEENLPAMMLYKRHGWERVAGETVWGRRILP